MSSKTSARTLLIVTPFFFYNISRRAAYLRLCLKGILEFQKIVNSFMEKFDEISGLVEKEKMKVS